MSESLKSIWNDINNCRKCPEVLFPLRPFLDSQELPVRYLLVALEPSVRKKPPSDWQEKRAEMALNFNSTGGDFAIRWAARKWLVDEGEGLYITDLAKCKIAVKDAPTTRELRFANCRQFLSREVALFSKTLTAIIPVGKESRRFCKEAKANEADWPRITRAVTHYGYRFAGTKACKADKKVDLTDAEWDAFREFVANKSSRPLCPGKRERAILSIYKKEFAKIRADVRQ
jgi:uracil-DNA glycosylase